MIFRNGGNNYTKNYIHSSSKNQFPKILKPQTQINLINKEINIANKTFNINASNKSYCPRKIISNYNRPQYNYDKMIINNNNCINENNGVSSLLNKNIRQYNDNINNNTRIRPNSSINNKIIINNLRNNLYYESNNQTKKDIKYYNFPEKNINNINHKEMLKSNEQIQKFVVKRELKESFRYNKRFYNNINNRNLILNKFVVKIKKIAFYIFINAIKENNNKRREFFGKILFPILKIKPRIERYILQNSINKWKNITSKINCKKKFYKLFIILVLKYFNNIRKKYSKDFFINLLQRVNFIKKRKKYLLKLFKKKENYQNKKLINIINNWKKKVKIINNNKIKSSKICYNIYKKKYLINKYFNIWKNKTYKSIFDKYKNSLKKKKNIIRFLIIYFDRKIKNRFLRKCIIIWRKNASIIKERKNILSLLIKLKINLNKKLLLLKYLLLWKHKSNQIKMIILKNIINKIQLKELINDKENAKKRKVLYIWKEIIFKEKKEYIYLKKEKFIKYLIKKRLFLIHEQI